MAGARVNGVRRGRGALVMLPLVVLLLIGADRAALLLLDGHDPHAPALLDGPGSASRPRYWFPALRAFLFHVWSLRIAADIRADRPAKALRHAREALAFAPDLPLARIELAGVLAWDLAAREFDESRRLAWMAEGLAVLDEGLRRDPFDPQLHSFRGLLIYNRGSTHPEFEQAFRRMYGRGTLDVATDAMVRAAELSRGTTVLIRRATRLLERRAEDALKRALDGEPTLLESAEADFSRLADFLQRLLRHAGPARDRLQQELDYASASRELCELLRRGAAGEAVALDRVRQLEQLRRAVPRDEGE